MPGVLSGLLSLARLAEEVRSGGVSPVELVHRTLERIGRLNPTVNAFITVLEDEAIRQAVKAEREIRDGRYRGPLHGIPVSLKDIIYIKGVRCTAGSKILAQHIAEYDATVTTRLRDAGAIIVGTNNLHEFASGVTSINPHYGPVRNPWNTRYIAGGSSGGSAAAVASGLTPVSIGTDTSGSVRIPASLCGVVGLKPSYGRVSKHGVIPLSWSLDHVGVLASTVVDAAIALKAIAGYDPSDESSVYAEVPDYPGMLERDIGGLRVCLLRNIELVDDEVAKAFERCVNVLEGLGITVEAVEFEYAGLVRDCWAPIRLGEAAAYHDRWFTEHGDDYGVDVRAMIERGRRYTAVDYVKAVRLRAQIRNSILRILDQYHAVISPTTPIPAVEIGRTETIIDGHTLDIYTALTSQTILYNITGLPAISIPAALTSHGLPIGFQIAGRPYDESTILRISHQVMEKLGTKQPFWSSVNFHS
jgi:aspartyl-tRNA(Asn)/glutamyl-tRNA(Gln) amidotransferase subunit A